jgi:hypothetical protein
MKILQLVGGGFAMVATRVATGVTTSLSEKDDPVPQIARSY